MKIERTAVFEAQLQVFCSSFPQALLVIDMELDHAGDDLPPPALGRALLFEIAILKIPGAPIVYISLIYRDGVATAFALQDKPHL